MMVPAFIGEDPHEARQRALEELVGYLNEGFDKDHPLAAAAHANLIQLIRAWQEAQTAPPNPFEREHGKPVPKLLKMIFPSGCPNWHEIEKRCRAWLPPEGLGANQLVVYVGEKGEKGEKGKPWTAWDFAIQHFIWLMRNPECERLGGPCPAPLRRVENKPRLCGKYFIRAGKKEKLYCSRECASNAAARISTKTTRTQEHDDKIKRALQAIQEWEKNRKRGRTKKGWKQYVSAEHPDISPKFLTTAVNKHELAEPANEGVRRAES